MSTIATGRHPHFHSHFEAGEEAHAGHGRGPLVTFCVTAPAAGGADPLAAYLHRALSDLARAHGTDTHVEALRLGLPEPYWPPLR